MPVETGGGVGGDGVSPGTTDPSAIVGLATLLEAGDAGPHETHEAPRATANTSSNSLKDLIKLTLFSATEMGGRHIPTLAGGIASYRRCLPFAPRRGRRLETG
ncbi:MAG: hypothetical protein Kow0063_19590 [Anaerolineae bacterium]